MLRPRPDDASRRGVTRRGWSVPVPSARPRLPRPCSGAPRGEADRLHRAFGGRGGDGEAGEAVAREQIDHGHRAGSVYGYEVEAAGMPPRTHAEAFRPPLPALGGSSQAAPPVVLDLRRLYGDEGHAYLLPPGEKRLTPGQAHDHVPVLNQKACHGERFPPYGRGPVREYAGPHHSCRRRPCPRSASCPAVVGRPLGLRGRRLHTVRGSRSAGKNPWEAPLFTVQGVTEHRMTAAEQHKGARRWTNDWPRRSAIGGADGRTRIMDRRSGPAIRTCGSCRVRRRSRRSVGWCVGFREEADRAVAQRRHTSHR